ncbi:MAG TPA: DUF819 family protein [Thermoanaerobaculia bacterium]
MNESTTSVLISSPEGVLAVLVAVVAFWFWLARVTGWKLFSYLVPLIWIYATPMALNNAGVIPAASPVYDALRQFGLPIFICLMLISIDVGAAVRVMGKGVAVMLLGTAGVVLGAPVGYFVVRGWLAPDAWKGFGALAGSWIGGTGNMAAVAGALETPPELFGLAALADNAVYVVWLPLLLASKAFADQFNRWTRVADDRLEKMEAAAAQEAREEKVPQMLDYVYLAFLAAGATWLAAALAPRIPEIEPILSTGTWKILLITTFGILLSLTPARRLSGSHNLAMALVYVFVAGIGARASLAGIGQAPAFLAGAFIWIFVHGAFCLFGAWLFRVDVHSAAIASAANIGGAASAPVVAAAHRESLVPASILMALIGYALGNYLALLAAQLCRMVGGV